jgi:soluble lytic murein transglycosylase-like protein
MFFFRPTVAMFAASIVSIVLAGNVCAQSTNQAANEAAAQALIDQAIRHEHAEGVNRDFDKALALYCEAGQLGSSDALLRMGWMYANGRGIARNDSIAASLFRKSAALGNEMAGRLSDMIRGDREELPACLTQPIAQNKPRPVSTATAPGAAATSAAASLPTPSIQNPADFRRSPPAAERKRLIDLVLSLAPQFRLDPRLVLALITQESNFDTTAKSTRNAQGLMQLIPETAERFAVADVWDPASNIRGGMAYLRWLLAYFKGDVSMALAGYNAGEGAVDKYRGIPPFAETMAYVQRIRSVYPFDRHPFDKSINVRISQKPAGIVPSSK